MNKIELGSSPMDAESDGRKSLRSIVFGTRARQFDALLGRTPSSAELTALSRKLGKSDVENVILDPEAFALPHTPLSPDEIELLEGYIRDGRKLVVFSENFPTNHIDDFKHHGIPIDVTTASRPSRRAFEYVCGRRHMDPKNTAVIGGSPITAIPLTPEGEEPFFPLNVLVEPMRPKKESPWHWGDYFRGRLRYVTERFLDRMVCARNSQLVRQV